MESEGELVVAIRNEIVKFDPFEKEMIAFRERFDGVVYDLTDEDQNKQARKDRREIGSVVAKLDGLHKGIKEPLLTLTRELDGRRKEIKDPLVAVQGKIKAQFDAHEAKDQARIAEITARIEAIKSMVVFVSPPKANVVELLLQGVREFEADKSFDEFQGFAALAKQETTGELERLLEEREKYEAGQAELERLRKEKETRDREEREARIAEEAAEEAKREAERTAQAERERVEWDRQEAQQAAQAERQKAERERVEAAERASRELAEANRRAELAADAERGRIEREQEQAYRKATEAREAEDKRKALKTHRKKIEESVFKALVRKGVNDDDAKLVVSMVSCGKIPHMEIVY